MAFVEFSAPITEIVDYTDGDAFTRLLRLKVPASANFSFISGQAAFLGHELVKHTSNPTQLKWGAFSIASSPLDLKEGNLDFCVTAKSPTGISSYICKQLKVGDSLRIKGPFGHYSIKPEYDHYFFVAAGSGIAPYISMVRTILKTTPEKKITVVFGFRTSAMYLYKEELEQYAREGKIEFIPTISRTDPSWKGKTGYVQNRIAEYAYAPTEKKCLYMCGAPAAIQAVKDAAFSKGFTEDSIFVEKWE